MHKTTTSNLFSYDWLTDSTRADYDALLDADALAYTQWRMRRTPPAHMSETTFRGWWNTVGPTTFATPDDAFRYRRELWVRVQAATEQAVKDALNNIVGLEEFGETKVYHLTMEDLPPKCEDPTCSCERCRAKTVMYSD